MIETIGRLHARLLRRAALTAFGVLLAFATGMPGATPAAAQCPQVPTPVRDIDLQRFYADKIGSVVDPRLAAAHKAEVAKLTNFLRQVTQDADKSWRRSKLEAQIEVGTCALHWIETWAKADAWLGTMKTKQAEYQRKWDLAGVALAYIKVRRFAEPAQRTVIEPWLMRFADTTRAFFNDLDRKRNNHWYWLGLAAGAVAIATDNPKYWDMARGIMQDAAHDIAPDGTLLAEVERKGRALHYHAFAVTPLVLLAELAASRGEDWYAFGDGALHRLADVTIAGLANPELFEKLTDTEQDDATRPGSGWYYLYKARFPAPSRVKLDDIPEGHRWLGGNVLVLSEVLANKGQKPN